MDKTLRALETQVADQQKQLARYETRLKGSSLYISCIYTFWLTFSICLDVVTAYKGLLKEKEALEAGFTAVSSGTSTTSENAKSTDPNTQFPTIKSTSMSAQSDELNQQMATLMNSLATLSAEKSRMEASFQADKRQLRQELAAKDKHIKDLMDKAKSTVTANGLEIEKVKSKLIVERHARDKEINDHMAMVRELQKLLSDERHLKENLEMQLSNLKAQFSNLDTSESHQSTELKHELEAVRRKYKELKNTARAAMASSSKNDTDANSHHSLAQLQSEMAHMKLQHLKAIANEQKRAQLAEERSKALVAVHEDRVVTLESRLAELSASVGTYDRMRQYDQESIFRLKEKIAQMESANSSGNPITLNNHNHNHSKTMESRRDITELIDEIVQLKKLLILENAKQKSPRDLSKLFATGNDHADCLEVYEQLNRGFAEYRLKSESLHQTVDTQTKHMRTLQDKIQVLNRNIDEQEQELKLKTSSHSSELRLERSKWKELVASMESDFRSKMSDIELQLQKQRERSLNLLEDKEQEIKTLRQSFEVLSNEQQPSSQFNEEKRKISASLSANGTAATTAANTTSDCHMLHYVHELSRKEVEITALRKAKNVAEASMRQALQDKVTTQQELHDRIGDLEDNVDRLERCKSRESANLEYLKNVVLSFLVANDTESKRHMVNAIGAVLEFNQSELTIIANFFAGRK